ncbi:uncharacterized protein B0P05DRAFT_110280 [Gilbertella persicaria]|uniref:uncharacterized protein n=1 Tax=Gilbertella persicaria TaxID=101096 RepID=UPI00222107EE|nr:uncharacterized protein B0P05DRAFT_110280 [Gilbertella persicaria]KAI8078099.1 hypothetical protein B0P05DRAFT_110280 [Gilbertella persicaria]
MVYFNLYCFRIQSFLRFLYDIRALMLRSITFTNTIKGDKHVKEKLDFGALVKKMILSLLKLRIQHFFNGS